MAAAFKDYYELTKPGMVYGNAIPLVGAFILGTQRNSLPWFPLGTLIVTLLGASLVIASGCVFNNYIEWATDRKMARTKHRALAAGRIPRRNAAIYAVALGIAGFLLLIIVTNLWATGAAALGFFFYVFAYSMWGKRRSPWGTFVGAVAGAMPPVIGYCAASGQLDTAAFILFAIMLVWQMPHFFAIAIRRLDEYKAAGIPVLPAIAGVHTTKIFMARFIAAFIIIAPLLFFFNYAGYGYLFVSAALGFAWLGICVRGFRIPEKSAANIAWARQMFITSLVVLTALFVTIAGGTILRYPPPYFLSILR